MEATTYTKYDGAAAAPGSGGIGLGNGPLTLDRDECKTMCTNDPDCDCIRWQEQAGTHGGTSFPAKACFKFTSCKPDNFAYDYPSALGTVTFMKDKTCYRYNLASTARYGMMYALNPIFSPCGAECDCRNMCSKQAECKADGNYCQADHDVSDEKCWCSVFTQTRWEGDSRTVVYCADRMTIDAIRAEAVVTDHIGAWQETIRCVAIRSCSRTLSDAGTYTESQIDTCIEASGHCPHPSDTIDLCEDWRKCVESGGKLRAAVMVLRGIANQQPSSPGLLQQNSGRWEAIGIDGCYENPFEHTKDDCPCFDEMEEECNQALTVLTGGSMFNCMMCKLCVNPNVCSTWKDLQCTDITCDTSLLAVHDTGKAEKATLIAELNDMSKSALHKHALAMRISTVMIGRTLDEDDVKAALIKLIVSQKVAVSRIADTIHGRRQSPGNTSSFEPAELEDALSGKAGSKSCR